MRVPTIVVVLLSLAVVINNEVKFADADCWGDASRREVVLDQISQLVFGGRTIGLLSPPCMLRRIVGSAFLSVSVFLQ